MPKPARPDLVFHNYDEMLADVDQLRAGPYEQAGQWSLAMTLHHLAKGMSGEGLKPIPWPMSAVARMMVRRMVKSGVYPSMKIPAAKATRPDPRIPMDTADAELRSVAAKLKTIAEPTVDTPFGKLSTEEFTKLMLLHAAHHLSFLKATPMANV